MMVVQFLIFSSACVCDIEKSQRIRQCDVKIGLRLWVSIVF